jgi:hypothetical protein
VVRLQGESGEVGLGESARAIMDSEIHGVYLHRRAQSQIEVVRESTKQRDGGMLLTPKQSHELASKSGSSESGYGLSGQVSDATSTFITPKQSHEAARCEPMYDQIPDFLISSGDAGAGADDGSAYDKHTT